MKKRIAMGLCTAMLLALFGCGAQTASSPEPTRKPTAVTTPTPATTPTQVTPPTQVTAPTEPAVCDHSWGQWTEKTKATCQTTGRQERICSLCQATESKTLDKTGHTESDWLVDTPAQVGVAGLRYTRCIHCKKQLQTREIPPLTEEHHHEIANWVTEQKADCTNPSREIAYCSCGKMLALKERPATGHSLSSKTLAPTESKGALRVYFCANCTYSYEEPMDFATALTFESNGDGTCKVTGLKDKTVTELVIPEKSPDGDRVVTIGSEAFYECANLVYVALPDTVTKIKYDAFYDCDNLKTVEFPKGTENLELEVRCFAFCGIEHLNLTQTAIDTISNNAFYGCKSLKTVQLGAVTVIDDLAFASCSELTSLIHAGSLVEIGERAFERCRKLTVLRAKDSVHNLDTVELFDLDAFSRSGIRDIVFSSNLRAINSAFDWCPDLGTVDFSRVSGKFTTFIGSTIDKLIFPSGITKISSGGFRDATIGQIELPDSITKIGNEAFCNATVGKITFGSGLTEIGAMAFKDAKATYDFSKVCKPLTIGYEAFANNDFISFAFPASTVSIGQGALMGCNKLQTLSIPFLAGDSGDTIYSTDCFAWLFGKNVDCWDQEEAVPSSLQTVILHGENPGTRAFFTVQITNLVLGRDITAIGSENFEAYSSKLKRVYYEGTQQEWDAIDIKTFGNQKLLDAEKYFYSETKPTAEGNFWYYNAAGAIRIW